MKAPPATIPPVFDLFGQEIKRGNFVVYSVTAGTSAETVIGLVTGFGWSKPSYSHHKPRVLVQYRQATPTRYDKSDDPDIFQYAKPCGKVVQLEVVTKRLASSSDHSRFVVIPEDSLPRDLAAFMRAKA